jgi:hypothetical protein
MSEKITYYALIWPGREEPTGIARRCEHESGFRDETLHKDMNWHLSSKIIEWKRGDATEDLVEIGEEEAKRLIGDFRERWKDL